MFKYLGKKHMYSQDFLTKLKVIQNLEDRPFPLLQPS